MHQQLQGLNTHNPPWQVRTGGTTPRAPLCISQARFITSSCQLIERGLKPVLFIGEKINVTFNFCHYQHQSDMV